MKSLFKDAYEVEVGSKCILVGEHSAIYGHLAIACPLATPSLRLSCNIAKQKIPTPTNWNQAWFASDPSGNYCQLSSAESQKLTQALETIFKQLTHESLDSYAASALCINSHIPLGAGLGGSAALSIAMIKLTALSLNLVLDAQQMTALSLEVDTFFHGNASGIDTSTIVAQNTTSFRRFEQPKNVLVKTAFWLVIVDSLERTSTQVMVGRVKHLWGAHRASTGRLLDELGEIAEMTLQLLEDGQLSQIGKHFNAAHKCLKELSVSTPKLNQLAQNLNQLGALGAKLSGGGGGGVVIGLFAKEPDSDQRAQFELLGPTFIVPVPSFTSSFTPPVGSDFG